MPNPIFNALGGMPQMGNMGRMIAQFNKFRTGFKGDPRQQIQELLNSGRMSQNQYNQLQQMAQAFMQMLPK